MRETVYKVSCNCSTYYTVVKPQKNKCTVCKQEKAVLKVRK